MTRIISIALGLVVGMSALADSPSYTALPSQSGTTNAIGYFSSKPNLQIRVVGAIATSDKSASVLSFRTGTTPQTISATNAAGTTITVASTNGLAVNDIVVIEGAAGVTNVTISSFPQSTNITCNVSTGIQTIPGDQVYKLGPATNIKVGATTATYAGEAIFVGQSGRPVRVVVDGTSACSLDSLTARYE